MINIRLAQSIDAPELQKLNDLFNGDGCNSLAAIEESLKNNKQEIVCVAADGDRLIGFCCGQIFISMCYNVNYGEITELFVFPEYRRKGIGKELMTFIESEFCKRGINHFQLFTGKTNKTAQAFYKSLQYIKSSELMFRKRSKDEKGGTL